MTGKEVAQAVVDTRNADIAAAHRMHTAHGENYDRLKAEEEQTWRAYQAAKQALRDHMYQTYGVDLISLQGLIQG